MDLLKTIAHYLLEVETLTKEDIEEIVETGRLSRWDDIIENDNIDIVPETTSSTETKTKTNNEVPH